MWYKCCRSSHVECKRRQCRPAKSTTSPHSFTSPPPAQAAHRQHAVVQVLAALVIADDAARVELQADAGQCRLIACSGMVLRWASCHATQLCMCYQPNLPACLPPTTLSHTCMAGEAQMATATGWCASAFCSDSASLAGTSS